MKKSLLFAASLSLFLAFSCDKKVEQEAVATDVVNVEGENVADAQQDLNESVIDAQNAVNSAQRELDDAKMKGDQVLTGAAQKKLDELQANLEMIQKNAGQAIQTVDGRKDGAEKVLDNTTDAAGARLENVENAAENVENKIK